MNTPFFRTLLAEEFESWYQGQCLIRDLLPGMAVNVTFPPFRKALEDMSQAFAGQEEPTRRLLTSLAPTSGGDNSNASLRTAVEEMRTLIQRNSRLDPSRIDARLLSLLRKAGHLQMASLKSLLLFAHMLEAGDKEDLLGIFLAQEIARDQILSDLAPSLLQWNAAETMEEGKKALKS